MLGTVQFGLKYGIANTTGKPSYETVKEILKLALDNGVTALDTAAAYGDSEEVLGKAMAELGIADKITVVSKVPPILEDNADPMGFIESSVARSLERLRIPVLPLVLFHREFNSEYLPLMQKLVDKGMILHGGVSLDSQAHAYKANEIDYIQVPGNVLDRRFDNAFSADRPGHVFIRSVYMQGMLLMPRDKFPSPELLAWRDKLESFGMPIHELCMRYLLSKPGPVSVLTGVDTVEQFRENIRAAEKGPLPEDVYKAVNEIIPAQDERLVRPACWDFN